MGKGKPTDNARNSSHHKNRGESLPEDSDDEEIGVSTDRGRADETTADTLSPDTDTVEMGPEEDMDDDVTDLGSEVEDQRVYSELLERILKRCVEKEVWEPDFATGSSI